MLIDKGVLICIDASGHKCWTSRVTEITHTCATLHNGIFTIAIFRP